MRYIGKMKTAVIPSVRIDPALRLEIEQSLQGGESLASLVEAAVRNEISRRKAQSEFVRRGLAAIERTLTAGDGICADSMVARLEQKLAAARKLKQA